MKKHIRLLALFGFFCLGLNSLYSQDMKKPVNEDEIAYLRKAFATIEEADQRYRSYLTYQTLDDGIIARIDSLMEADGVGPGWVYAKSLKLSLPESTKDSLHALQHQLDFQNHLMIRGVWEIYGFIPEEIVPEKNYVQLLLLVHPQKDWEIPKYHAEYSQLLRAEVDAGRMPARTYATFYDNILGKIMRKPQLYGTNEQFDAASGQVLPPEIGSLETANAARKELGLPELKEGEYRLAEKMD